MKTKLFESSVTTAQEGISILLDHGLGGTPQIVRGVLVNLVVDATFSPGDEIDLSGIGEDPGDQAPPFVTMGANATQVFLNVEDLYNSGAVLYVRRGGGSARVTLNTDDLGTHWGVKVYAVRFIHE